MLLSVIIPHHEEDKNVIKPLFDSLNNQIGISFKDLEILLCNDSKSHVVEDFSEYANLNGHITNLFSPYECNPGMSRQIGIDNAKGDYILFCDCDDMLYSPTLLFDLFSRVCSNADVYSFNFIEECRIGNKTVFNVKGHNETWVFAKLYKTEFLRTKNIRFSPQLTWHEDSYFNGLFFAHNPKLEVLSYPGYLWRFNPKSLTRQNNFEYACSSLVALIDSADLLLQTIKNQNIRDLSFINKKAFDLIGSIYVKLQQLNTDKYRAATEKRLVAFIQRYDAYLNCISKESQAYVSMVLRSDILFVPQEGFVNFVIRIMQGEIV